MLYVIGDLHLSLHGGKEMDIFGGAWRGYVDKIRRGFAALRETDTVVLCGDTSWGMNLREALPDFRFLEELPGYKLLVKGNHDYFWETAAKQQRFFRDNGLCKLGILHNNAFPLSGAALCGTRGWFYEERHETADEKIFQRELIRLRASLEAGRKLAPDGELVAFLHYPPAADGYTCEDIFAIFAEFGVRRCYYGHLHGAGRAHGAEGYIRDVYCRLISADNVDFTPVAIEL